MHFLWISVFSSIISTVKWIISQFCFCLISCWCYLFAIVIRYTCFFESWKKVWQKILIVDLYPLCERKAFIFFSLNRIGFDVVFVFFLCEKWNQNEFPTKREKRFRTFGDDSRQWTRRSSQLIERRALRNTFISSCVVWRGCVFFYFLFTFKMRIV